MSDGKWLVTYSGQDEWETGVFAKLYEPTGELFIDEFRVNSEFYGFQGGAHSVALSDGSWITVWNSWEYGNNYGIPDLVGQKFDSNGSRIGEEFEVGAFLDNPGYQVFPTSLNENTWIAIFSGRQNYLNHTTYAEIYGVEVGAAIKNFAIAENTSSIPSAAKKLTNDTFVVTWNGKVEGETNYDIYAKIFSLSGAPISTNILVNEYTTYGQYSPVVASLSDGGFIVSWESEIQDGSYTGIYAQQFSADGTKIGSEIRVNEITDGDQREPAVVGLDNGGWVIIWDHRNINSNPDTPSGVYAQLFDENGEPYDTYKFITETRDGINYPGLMSLPDGGFIAYWRDSPGHVFVDGEWTLVGTEIFAQRFDDLGNNVSWVEPISFNFTSETPSGSDLQLLILNANGLPTEATINADGSLTIGLERGNSSTYQFSASYSSSLKAVTSADALDALKLSVGLTPSNGTPTAYDYIAADFNRDGKVTSSDALEILKYAVGLEVERDAEWVFLRNDADLTTLNKNSVEYDTNILIEDITSDATIGLTGILIGDVNDSYSGLIT